jgi:hypothetical protein
MDHPTPAPRHVRTALVGVLLGPGLLVLFIVMAVGTESIWLVWLIIPGALGWLLSLFGFIVNGPNMARVVQIFGAYVGTVKDTGFFYGNRLYSRTRVSVRVRILETGVISTEEKKERAGKPVLDISVGFAFRVRI